MRGGDGHDVAALVERLSAAGVHYVCCSMVDTGGINRVKCVPVEKLERAARLGIGVPLSWSMAMSNDHFAQPEGKGGPSGDLRLKPDLAAAVQLAAQPFWAWVPMDQHTQDGAVFPICQRSFLKNMVTRARDAGFDLLMSYEFEWFTMRDDHRRPPGEPLDVARDAPEPGATYVPVHEGPGFSSAAWAAVHELAEELLLALGTQGMDVEVFHPEYADGQMEVSFAPVEPLAAADRNVLFRHTTRAVSEKHGCRASFAPVRVAGQVASGCHLHFSLRDAGGRNLFAGGRGRLELTPPGEAFLAGVLAEIGPLTALGCPTVPSYERLQPQRWACAYRIWGHENREAALRVIQGMAGERACTANAEFRAIDAACNPYLMAGALIAAGLSGIDRSMRLPEPFDGDPHLASEDDRAALGVRRLPLTLSQAAEELAASEVLRAAMGDELHSAIVEVRRAEAAADEGRPLDDLIAEHLWRF
jgi:glutamine synthetase